MITLVVEVINSGIRWHRTANINSLEFGKNLCDSI